MDIEMSAQSFGILGLHTDDNNFAAGVALCNMLDGDERFIKSLPDRPANPDRIAVIGELALDPEYLFGAD